MGSRKPPETLAIIHGPLVMHEKTPVMFVLKTVASMFEFLSQALVDFRMQGKMGESTESLERKGGWDQRGGVSLGWYRRRRQ